MTKVDRLLQDLKRLDPGASEKTLDQIEEMSLSREQSLKLVAAATEDFPESAGGPPDQINYRLLTILGEKHNQYPELVPALERAYDKLAGKDTRVREAALFILTTMQTKESLAALLCLLDRPASRDLDLGTALLPLEGAPPVGRSLFPGLFEVVWKLDGRYDVLKVILKYASTKRVNLNAHPAFVERCVERATELLQKSASAIDRCTPAIEGQPHPDEIPGCNKEIILAYYELEMLLDLVGWMQHASIARLLEQALALKSPKLRVYAASSLLRRGQQVPPAVWDGIAAAPAGRALLWHVLEGRGRPKVFPQRYLNQQALAEADMVQWLEFPTEYGCAPEEIELLKRVEYQDRDGAAQAMFLFKFRHRAASDGKWEVGWSGPCAAGKALQLGGGYTFSNFEKLESKSLDEHVKDCLPED